MSCVFTLRHIGINNENAEEALALAELLSGMFNLAPRRGQKSEFAGPYFECMKAPFHGRNGHIAMQTPDLESAVAELKEKGVSFREETAAYDDAGKLKNIYLAGEYGGFAIHILRGCRKDNLCAKTEKSAIRTDGASVCQRTTQGPPFLVK